MPESSEHKTDFYLSRRMAVEHVRQSAEKLKADFLEQMEVKLNAVINDVVHTMQKADTFDRYQNVASPSISSSSSPILSSQQTAAGTAFENGSSSFTLHRNTYSTSSHPPSKKNRKLSLSGKLPEKVFVSRPSPLTELLQVTHFKTIHHIFIATLILIMLHNIILDLVERNTVDLGLVRLMWAFGQPQMTLGILLGLEFCGLVVIYPSFDFWSRTRHRVKPELRKLVDYTGALSFLLLLTGMICVPAQIMWNNPLPPASGATVTMEQCRLLMKIYAFVRSNVPRVLSSTACATTASSRNSQRSNNTSSTAAFSSSLENSCAVSRKQKSDEEEDEEERSSSSKLSSLSKSPPTTPMENNGGNQEEETLVDGGDDGDNGTWTSTKATAARITTTDFATTSPQEGSELKRRKGGRRRNGEKSWDVDGKEKNDEDNGAPSSPETTKQLKLMSLTAGGGESGVDGDCDNFGGTCGTCPSYSKYLYFYVAPTLIYKDNYPRTSFVRWDYVCWNFAQVLGCIVYANFILSRYSTSYFINFGHPDHPMTVLQFCNAVFSMMLPGILGLVLGFYLLLHSWHNAFAEMLCFGDRLFYKDWWNCSSFHSYYKTWNILVHDWLYTYIFKDAWEFGLAKYNKALPTILVFVISSLFHEYVLSFTFNFFFPVLLTLFGGFGLALTFVRNSDSALGNIFMWSGLIAGSGILVSTYTMEFYARLNCPERQEDATADFFTPRFWTCNALVWK